MLVVLNLKKLKSDGSISSPVKSKCGFPSLRNRLHRGLSTENWEKKVKKKKRLKKKKKVQNTVLFEVYVSLATYLKCAF